MNDELGGQQLATCLLADSCWNYFFEPEDWGDMFLRNVGSTQQTTRRHIPEDDTLHNHRCENLKFYKKFVNIWWSLPLESVIWKAEKRMITLVREQE
jgi:hypothetical protein